MKAKMHYEVETDTHGGERTSGNFIHKAHEDICVDKSMWTDLLGLWVSLAVEVMHGYQVLM